MHRATLVLADGEIFEGFSFGNEGQAQGEVVFNTSMAGYQEILTDPSYCQQIVVLTAPMIGNYGVNADEMESQKIQAAGLIVKEYCPAPSNWKSSQSLGDFLKANQTVAASGMPTREITRKIRRDGAMPGILSVGERDLTALKRRASGLAGMEGQNLVAQVTCRKPYLVPAEGAKKYAVTAYDFGIKKNILRELAKRGCDILVVPAGTPASEVLGENPDGVLLSNGPGDPAACGALAENIRGLIGKVPMFGICLGHQLLSLALGGRSFKLKFGHRGGNQPVKDLETGRVFITSQNHGFAIDAGSCPEAMIPTQINLNDRTLEAFRHPKYPILSVQYHPEAAPGPNDAKSYFDRFCRLMGENKKFPGLNVPFILSQSKGERAL